MDDASARSANSRARRDLTRIYAAAVSAVAPAHLIGRALGGELEGAEKVPALLAGAARIFLLAAGKAALGMATELAPRLSPKLYDALAIVPSLADAGQAAPSDTSRATIRIIVAAHPLPDASSQRAAEAALEIARHAGSGDLLVFALSGGASSLMAAPAAPVTLADKIAISAALLGSGASIRELNIVRRHLSAIKGGGLLRACGGARVSSLILSDVAHNDLAAIGSGPTAADYFRGGYRRAQTPRSVGPRSGSDPRSSGAGRGRRDRGDRQARRPVARARPQFRDRRQSYCT
jgi:glycerate 2-kinase